MDVQIEEGADFLIVSVAGPYSLKGTLGMLEKAASAAHTHGLRRILVDASKVTGDPSDVDRYDVGKESAHIFAHVERLALVHWATARYTGFAFHVAQNRGLDARPFRERSEAERWLTSA